ncbi:hypothetical protein [Pararhizobium qamdonense]|uniref:hypothetical protein n=1 Tax=Pararhizobium qamdonense TaxID=3031126 RepID=UPI0023E2D74E|nr:hypothetical protein [Pararhizobium qamdonense]
MTFYAWTISVPPLADIARVTELKDLEETLRALNLPGTAPADWIIHSAQMDENQGRAEYIHDENGSNEWSLTWTKLGEDAPPLAG